MTVKKYKLTIINKGKPFTMPKWTVGKHKAALARMLKENPSATDEEKNDLFNFYVIYETLKQVDPEVSIEDVKGLHPEDMVELFNEVYNAGKEGIYFRQPEKGKK